MYRTKSEICQHNLAKSERTYSPIHISILSFVQLSFPGVLFFFFFFLFRFISFRFYFIFVLRLFICKHLTSFITLMGSIPNDFFFSSFRIILFYFYWCVFTVLVLFQFESKFVYVPFHFSLSHSQLLCRSTATQQKPNNQPTTVAAHYSFSARCIAVVANAICIDLQLCDAYTCTQTNSS